MRDIYFRDDHFVLTNCTQYEISIQVSLDGFSFLIQDEETGKILFYRNLGFTVTHSNLWVRKIKELAEDNHDILFNEFKVVKVYFAGKSYSLLPASYHSAKLASHPVSSRGFDAEGMKTMTLPLESFDAIYTFQAPKDLIDYFLSIFPSCVFSHEGYLLLQNSHYLGKTSLHFHFHNDWFWAIQIRDKMLSLINVFDYLTMEDALFYMLTLIRQEKMEDSVVYVSGRLEADGPLMSYLKEQLPAAVLFDQVEYPDRIVPYPVPCHTLPSMIRL